jgi:hypothetical protein
MGSDERELTNPGVLQIQNLADQDCDSVRSCRVNPEQDYATRSEALPALNCELPEIPVQREQNSSLLFRAIEEKLVVRGREVSSGPKNVVLIKAQPINDGLGKILVGEESHHSSGNWIGPEFVSKVAGVRETG